MSSVTAPLLPARDFRGHDARTSPALAGSSVAAPLREQRRRAHQPDRAGSGAAPGFQLQSFSRFTSSTFFVTLVCLLLARLQTLVVAVVAIVGLLLQVYALRRSRREATTRPLLACDVSRPPRIRRSHRDVSRVARSSGARVDEAVVGAARFVEALTAVFEIADQVRAARCGLAALEEAERVEGGSDLGRAAHREAVGEDREPGHGAARDGGARGHDRVIFDARAAARLPPRTVA